MPSSMYRLLARSLARSLALGCASSEAGEGEEEASTPVTRGTSSPGGEARGA